MSDATLRNNTAEQRYELVDGDAVVGIAAYELADDSVVFTHTEVGAGYEGRGYGSALARQALDDVRGRGLQVVPACDFIADYMRRHLETLTLMAPEIRAQFDRGDDREG